MPLVIVLLVLYTPYILCLGFDKPFHISFDPASGHHGS
jgi:hypothetical protein